MEPAVIQPHWLVVFELTAEYFTMALAAALGVIQAAAAFSGRSRLLFFSRPFQAYLFAALTTGPAMTGFFTWNWRNPTGLIEGSQQFVFFSLACACAIGLSILLSYAVREAGLDRRYDAAPRRRNRTFKVTQEGGGGSRR